MMKRILAVFAILASASVASADPIWKFDQTIVGDKLIGVTASINLNDALGGPAALIVTFNGAIRQSEALSEDGNATIDQSSGGSGVGAIRTDTSALFDYTSSLDSWFYFGTGTNPAQAWREPIAPFGGITGGAIGSNSFSMSAGSGTGVAGQVPGDVFIPVAYLVIDLQAGAAGGAGGAFNPNRVLNYTYQTGHASTDGTQSVQFPSSGFAQGSVRLIPEPSSVVLAGLGAIAMLGMVWRRRQSA